MALNTAPGFAGHVDWHLPSISELQSLMVGPGVLTTGSADPPDPAFGTNPTGQSTFCGDFRCMDPDFAAVGGPTGRDAYYLSGSSGVLGPDSPDNVWVASFTNSHVSNQDKQAFGYVRAVRPGSCAD